MQYTSVVNEATSQVTIVNGTEKLVLATADGVEACKAVKFVSSLLDTPVLPESLLFTPFRIRFKPDGGAQLTKEGFGSVSFDKETYEDLITIINMTVQQCADKLRIRGGARAGVSNALAGEPVS